MKVTGVTVHLVDEGMDTGPILAQRAVDVVDGDVDKTAEAIHAVEHDLYKETLNSFLAGNLLPAFLYINCLANGT